MHEPCRRVRPERIIFLSGKQGSGKSYHANMLSMALKRLGYGVRIFKFAHIMYEMHDAILPILKKYGLRPETMTKDGDFLQCIGQWGREKIGENVWAHATRKEIFRHVKMSLRYVAIVDDGRMENEFDVLPEAVKIRFYAPESARKARCSYWRSDVNHPSETGLDNYELESKFNLLCDTMRDRSLIEQAVLNFTLSHFQKIVDCESL